MIQSGVFLDRLLRLLLKTGLPLINNVIKPLAKSILIRLGLTTAASAAFAGIHKKISELGTTTLIISNDEMKYIIKIVKSLEESGLLLKEVSEKFLNKAKKQQGGFLSMLLGTVGASLYGNILAGKGAIATRQRRRISRAGERIVQAGYGNKKTTKWIFNIASSFD